MDSSHPFHLPMNETDVKHNLDLVTRLTGYGALSEASTNAMMGFNHRGAGVPVPVNTDNNGLTFFTRPRLNLSYDNIAQDRVMTTLMSRDEKSYARALRVLLDPVGARDRPGLSRPDARDGVIRSALVDDRNPFIPLLSNYLISLSGWPDPVAEYFESSPGVEKEVWSMIDGPVRIRSSFDLHGSWRNVAGDPITSLLYYWITYALNVYRGNMVPYPEAVIENEIDYNTRIYRFILDPSKQYVQKVAACGAAFPLGSPMGAAFNFSADSVYSEETQRQVSAGFHCMGVEYQDPILFYEFNQLVSHFNPDMRDGGIRRSRMIRLLKEELELFNYHGYPRVDPITYAMQWWVYPDEYTRVTGEKVNPNRARLNP